MRINSRGLLAIVFATFAGQALGQVLSPDEIADPAMRALQQSHLQELRTIAVALVHHQFPYHFYLSRKLDLSEREEESSDQRAIQFDKFQGQVVLKFTGNYFAAYSAERMTKE